MSKYKFEGKKFEGFRDASSFARDAMIGRHFDDHGMIFEWQKDGEFWEPVSRVEYDRNHQKWVCRR